MDALKAFEAAVEEKEAKAPPGWEKSVKKMKKHPEIDNPWALAWSMKNKGYTPGGKDKKAEDPMSELSNFQDALIAQRVVARVAKVWPSRKQMNRYLDDHPDADRKKHRVETKREKEKGDEEHAKSKEDFSKSEGAAEVKKLQTRRNELKKDFDRYPPAGYNDYTTYQSKKDKLKKEDKRTKEIKELDKKIRELKKPSGRKQAPMEMGKEDKADRIKKLKSDRRKLKLRNTAISKGKKLAPILDYEGQLKAINKELKELGG